MPAMPDAPFAEVADSDARYPYAGPPALRAAVDGALRGVVDPEIALSIVDVGLVYGVAVGPGHASVTLTTTSAACPLSGSIADEVVDALQAVLPAGTAVEVALTWSPPWAPERLSAHARTFLGWDGGDSDGRLAGAA